MHFIKYWKFSWYNFYSLIFVECIQYWLVSYHIFYSLFHSCVEVEGKNGRGGGGIFGYKINFINKSLPQLGRKQQQNYVTFHNQIRSFQERPSPLKLTISVQIMTLRTTFDKKKNYTFILGADINCTRLCDEDCLIQMQLRTVLHSSISNYFSKFSSQGLLYCCTYSQKKINAKQ